MAALLPFISAGVGAAGAIQQGNVARAEAKSAQNIDNFNAQLQEREAEAERARAGFASKRQAEEAARIKSAQVVDIAKAGGLGSPVARDLVSEQAAELEFENLLIGFEGEVRARKAKSQAELDILQGKFTGSRGRNLQRASTVRAIGRGSQVFLGGLN